jgi:hypothetical protein
MPQTGGSSLGYLPERLYCKRYKMRTRKHKSIIKLQYAFDIYSLDKFCLIYPNSNSTPIDLLEKFDEF